MDGGPISKETMNLEKRLKHYTKTLSKDETPKIAKLLAAVPRNARVIEVGSGFGGKMEMLRGLGFSDILGVEKNPDSVALARSKGMNSVTLEAFDADPPIEKADLLVLSHIIEHLPPYEVVDLMEYYLPHLKTGGRVLIVSPVFHPHFFLDLDHVKPYYPQSIKVFFGKNDEQIAYYSPFRLKLRDVYFCKKSHRIKMCRSLLLKQRRAVLIHFLNFLLALAFKGSFKLIGRTNSWAALFEKM